MKYTFTCIQPNCDAEYDAIISVINDEKTPFFIEDDLYKSCGKVVVNCVGKNGFTTELKCVFEELVSNVKKYNELVMESNFASGNERKN